MTHNYHVMPDGTPIPGEGLPCKCIGQHGETLLADVYMCMPLSKEGILRFFTSQGWVLDAEPIREPEYVPLTLDDYNDEPVRVSGFTEVFWPLSASERGIVLDEDAGPESWARLAKAYEYRKDGVWQPMRKVKQ
jgi:hypothetical protein